MKSKRLRHLIALTLSVLMLLCTIPESALISYAMENRDVETELEVDNTETLVEEPTETLVEEPTETLVEEPAETPVEEPIEIPTEESGDEDISDVETYQSKKLSVKVKKSKLYNGESDALVATIGYENTTIDEGLGYQVVSIQKNGVATDEISVDNSNPYELRVSVPQYAFTGKFEVVIAPIVPNGIYAETTKITIEVIESIYSLTVTGPSSVNIPYNNKKNITVQLQATPYSIWYAPMNSKNYEWSLDEENMSDYDRQYFSIDKKSGKVTIDKNYKCYDYVGAVSVKVKATDYEGNTATGTYNIFLNMSNADFSYGDPAVKNLYGEWFRNNDAVYAEQLNNARLYLTYSGAYFDPEYGYDDYDLVEGGFNFKSSSKDVAIDSDGRITVKEVTGRPVTLTVTAPNGKVKKSITLKLVKKPISFENLELKSFEGSITLDTENSTAHYNDPSIKPVIISFAEKGAIDSSVYDLKVSVKGGKVVKDPSIAYSEKMKYTVDYTRRSQVLIFPTAGKIEITVKLNGETKVYTLVNDAYSTAKVITEKNEPKVTNSISFYRIDDVQTRKLYVGKKFVGGKVYISTNYAINNYAVWGVAESYIPDVLAVDEEGYITITQEEFKTKWNGLESSSASFGTKIPNNLKAKMVIEDKEGNYYAPVNLNIAVANQLKTDYKLITSYNIKKYDTNKVLSTGKWLDVNDGYVFDEDEKKNYHYYQQLKYSGTKVPADKIEFTGFRLEIASDKLNGAEIGNYLNVCYDEAGNYYLAIEDTEAYKLLVKANIKTLEKNDYTKCSADGKVSGYIYVKYNLVTVDGYVIPKEDKIKVSIVIPKNDYSKFNVD